MHQKQAKAQVKGLDSCCCKHLRLLGAGIIVKIVQQSEGMQSAPRVEPIEPSALVGPDWTNSCHHHKPCNHGLTLSSAGQCISPPHTPVPSALIVNTIFAAYFESPSCVSER